MDAEVTDLAGPKGKHNPASTAKRHGSEHGTVTLGGRRVGVRRPRVRTVQWNGVAVRLSSAMKAMTLATRSSTERNSPRLSSRRARIEHGVPPISRRIAYLAPVGDARVPEDSRV